MINFTVKFRTGIPIYEQIIYSAKKAIVSEQLKPGDRFPSVRDLSKELRINPNTAQKVVSFLVREKLLEVIPGIGSVVSERCITTKAERDKFLNDEVEKLVVESKRLAVKKKEVMDAIDRHWKLDDKEGRNE